jgi:hypothetical protein
MPAVVFRLLKHGAKPPVVYFPLVEELPNKALFFFLHLQSTQ